MLLLSFLFLRENVYIEPGYNPVLIPDYGLNISLNYTLDNIFLFDYPNSYQIKVKFLDMIEPEIINPNSYGFSGQFLTNVEIKPEKPGSHIIQLFSLPKDYCSHNYISYFFDQHQKTRLYWSNTKQENFQICYLYQFPGRQARLTAKLNANSLSNASYASPKNYINNDFAGTPISKSTEFDLDDGMIIRVQGHSSSSSSSFELSIKPKKSQSNSINNFASLPFYFVVSSDGLKFEDDLDVQLQSMPERFLNLSITNILGITLSAAILLLVIIFTTSFLIQKFNCFKNKKKSI